MNNVCGIDHTQMVGGEGGGEGKYSIPGGSKDCQVVAQSWLLSSVGQVVGRFSSPGQ